MVGEHSFNARASLLAQWLAVRLAQADLDWLSSQIGRGVGESGDRSLQVVFGLIPRRLGKAPLALMADDLAAADACVPGWTPAAWTVADAGRILLLAALPEHNPEFAPRFRSLCQTAEVAEAISLYRGLPLYPEPAALEPQVGEGLRSNMRSVFEAIAHHNPYPRHYFDQHRWNHMVLKAIFIGSRLAPIQGLDERANEELARIMSDFAHERWAAARAVPIEIWRCVGPFACGALLADLENALSSIDPTERRAAALALAASPDPAAADLLRRAPVEAAQIAAGTLTWAALP